MVKKTQRPEGWNLLTDFRDLLASTPLGFAGTMSKSGGIREAYWQELVSEFEARLAAAEQELGELRARAYDDQQSGADYG